MIHTSCTRVYSSTQGWLETNIGGNEHDSFGAGRQRYVALGAGCHDRGTRKGLSDHVLYKVDGCMTKRWW